MTNRQADRLTQIAAVVGLLVTVVAIALLIRENERDRVPCMRSVVVERRTAWGSTYTDSVCNAWEKRP